ncbi:unnamed protein product [Owenia fusiformis]|uniref:Fucosyltransferase n=1 Tax=Owenia fusiformis TaxID=6347 RepID=A0A8J1XNS4_OWEFU|nr:unnamed protein product [Owenia fusiformis]
MSMRFVMKEKWTIFMFIILVYISFWTYQVNIFLSKPMKNSFEENMALVHDTNEKKEQKYGNMAHVTGDKYVQLEHETHHTNVTLVLNQNVKLENEETISASIENNNYIDEPTDNEENGDNLLMGSDQQSICEPEIIQHGSNYKMAKQTWKYKIVQWMPYQRKVVGRELKNTSMGEFWQVDNCLVIDHFDVENADAVVVPIMSLNPYEEYAPPRQFPPSETRKASQIWILLHNDHPYFLSSRQWGTECLDNYFNWTMTYRSTSDIHIPYGNSFPKDSPTDNGIDYTIGKTKMVSAMVSGYQSQNFRMEYIKELENYIQVDMFGRYGIPCYGHYFQTCPLLKLYKFYLAFENSNCEEYVTEKLWLNGYHNNVLPVVMGATKEFYTSIAPPYSYIHIEDFKTPQHLAHYLRYLNSNDTAYNEYFKWRDTHDYCYSLLHLGMQPWKVICEKLNSFNGEHKVYKNMSTYLDPESQCRPAHWEPKEEISKQSIDFIK